MHDKEKDRRYLVLKYVGQRIDQQENLEKQNLPQSLFKYLADNPEPEKLKEVARKMLGCLKALHEQKVLHRNVCPENFLVDQNDRDMKIYIIDFAHAADSTHAYWDSLDAQCERRYQSVRSLRGDNYKYLDDLESLGYCLIQLATKATFDLDDRTKKKDLSTLPEKYSWIANFIQTVRNHQDEPDYGSLERAMQNDSSILPLSRDIRPKDEAPMH